MDENFLSYFIDYYENIATSDLFNYQNWKFRHIRFVNIKNNFIRIKDNIYNSEQLLHHFRKKIPLHAYFTPNLWLNPIYVSKSKDQMDVLLSDNLYFDIDMHHLNEPSLENTKNNTLDLLEFMESEFELIPSRIVYSGQKGFHLYYDNINDKNLIELHPSERLSSFIKKRKEITTKVTNANIVIDTPVTLDPFRILRIPNSIHGSTGFRCQIIKSLKDFKQRDAWIFKEEFYHKFLGNKLELYL